MNRLKRITIAGTLFVLLTGTLAHFVYAWSGDNTFVGLFTPVNESTWEHMKLLFFPMLLFTLFLPSKYRSEAPCLTGALLTGLLLGTALIPVIFYTYTGILGYDVLPLDLATFALSVILAFYAAYRLARSCRTQEYTLLLYALTWLLLFCFLLFTYFPPQIGLFQEPVG